MADPTVTREEFARRPALAAERGVIHKPLSTLERIYNLAAVRKLAILVLLGVAWEGYARLLNNPRNTLRAIVTTCIRPSPRV